jgi:protein phosphatase 2C family protein 2/3
MEDSHSVHLFLPTPGSDNSDSDPPSASASDIPVQPQGSTVTNDNGEAVFDGHGGSSVAKFAGTTIHSRLTGLDSYSASAKPHVNCAADVVQKRETTRWH